MVNEHHELDVVEACADALLSACALAIQLTGEQPSFEGSRKLAIGALDAVLERTEREGGKPR